jgi:hypothetical protein
MTPGFRRGVRRVKMPRPGHSKSGLQLQLRQGFQCLSMDDASSCAKLSRDLECGMFAPGALVELRGG